MKTKETPSPKLSAEQPENLNDLLAELRLHLRRQQPDTEALTEIQSKLWQISQSDPSDLDLKNQIAPIFHNLSVLLKSPDQAPHLVLTIRDTLSHFPKAA